MFSATHLQGTWDVETEVMIWTLLVSVLSSLIDRRGLLPTEESAQTASTDIELPTVATKKEINMVGGALQVAFGPSPLLVSFNSSAWLKPCCLLYPQSSICLLPVYCCVHLKVELGFSCLLHSCPQGLFRCIFKKQENVHCFVLAQISKCILKFRYCVHTFR